MTIARRFCLWVRMWVSDLTHTLTRTDFVGKVNKSPEIVRFRDFFRTFVSNIFLAVFSDPNADPNGSG